MRFFSELDIVKRTGLTTAFAFTFLITSTSILLTQGTVRQQGQDVDLGWPNPTWPTTTIQPRAAVKPTQAMHDMVRDISKYGRYFNQNFVVII